MNKYYTYILCDPRKPGNYSFDNLSMCFLYEPFYVGKGSKKRYQDHTCEWSLHGTNKLKNSKIHKIIDLGLSPLVVLAKTDLLEEEAFLLEKNLIQIIGRVDVGKGTLSNMTSGGDGSSPSQEVRDRISQSLKNRPSPMKGRRHSEETRKRMSEAHKGQKRSSPTEEARKKMSEAKKGRPSPKRGIPISEEQKEKIRKANKNYIPTEEARKKISEALKGKPTWNKGKSCPCSEKKRLSIIKTKWTKRRQQWIDELNNS